MGKANFKNSIGTCHGTRETTHEENPQHTKEEKVGLLRLLAAVLSAEDDDSDESDPDLNEVLGSDPEESGEEPFTEEDLRGLDLNGLVHLALHMACFDLDTALEVADDAFKGKEMPWVSYCVRETLIRWFLNAHDEKHGKDEK